MAKKKPKSARRKRRTREHVIADLSINFVERHVLLCGFTVERFLRDYGIDLTMYTYNKDGEVEAGEIYLQLKATDNLKVLKDGKKISVRIETADVGYWLEQSWPVILIVYDAIEEKAYWLYVQAHFQKKSSALDLSKKEMNLHIPTANTLNGDAIIRFAQFKEQVLAQQKGINHHE